MRDKDGDTLLHNAIILREVTLAMLFIGKAPLYAWLSFTNMLFQTGIPATFPNGQYQFNGITVPVFEARNSSRLTSYHRVDLSANYSPNPNSEKRFKGEWVFSLYNY